eukprot:TRINITY_DN883_c0_g1_i1.p1 TRINITY_DN883_c0_g1~~TRINITY_DN883_c0_g1_i1.p1  ORF type:complete len:317 (-),score=75.10 TRINITY_DN883_c0_g1_i1:51-974(-)
MKLIVIALSIFAVAVSASLRDEFEAYKIKYGKVYADDENDMRYKIYQSNARFVKQHNHHHSDRHNVGINKFADMTTEEYLNMLSSNPRDVDISSSVPSMIQLPASVDWRKHGVVGDVVDQGQEGCPTGFAVTTAVASAYAISGSKYAPLSTEQVCNCTQVTETAEKYIVDTGVLFADNHEKTCPTQKIGSGEGVCVGIYNFVASGNEGDLAAAVAKQPVAVVIDASQTSFQLYTNGIYYEPACSNTTLDHDLLIVGYGSSKGSDYWIAQNTWGADWGMEGYIWLAKDKDNNCGVASDASYPMEVKAC